MWKKCLVLTSSSSEKPNNKDYIFLVTNEMFAHQKTNFKFFKQRLLYFFGALKAVEIESKAVEIESKVNYKRERVFKREEKVELKMSDIG